MASAANLTERNVLLIVFALALVLSIPSLLTLSHISPIYNPVDATVRNAVFHSSFYLQSHEGLLISTVHLVDVRADDQGLVTSLFSFQYPSRVRACPEHTITVTYDTRTSAVTNYESHYGDAKDPLC